jgi:3-methyladenine DNA glycosylase Tag
VLSSEFTKNTMIKNGELQFMTPLFWILLLKPFKQESWITILNKKNFRAAFDQFDYKK